MADTKVTVGGLSFPSALALVLIVLKLTHYIDWSWWWILLPLYAPFVAVLAFLLFCAIMAFIVDQL